MSISEYNLSVDTSFNPPKVTVTPRSFDRWYVQGKQLMTPDHTPFQVRGVEQAMWYEGWFDIEGAIREVGASGANTMRIVPNYKSQPPSGTRLTAGQIQYLMGDVVEEGMLIDVAVDGGKDFRVYSEQAVKDAVQFWPFESVVHAKGEGYESTAYEWRVNSMNVINYLRSLGYQQPLYIMSRDGGRNLPTILTEGQNVLDADPLKSVVFGWQAYWGSSNYYQGKYGLTMTQALQKVKESPLCIQVGVIEHTDQGKPEVAPYRQIIDTCNSMGVGWLWWDWRLGPDSLGYGTYKGTPAAVYVRAQLAGATKWSGG